MPQKSRLSKAWAPSKIRWSGGITKVWGLRSGWEGGRICGRSGAAENARRCVSVVVRKGAAEQTSTATWASMYHAVYVCQRFELIWSNHGSFTGYLAAASLTSGRTRRGCHPSHRPRLRRRNLLRTVGDPSGARCRCTTAGSPWRHLLCSPGVQRWFPSSNHAPSRRTWISLYKVVLGRISKPRGRIWTNEHVMLTSFDQRQANFEFVCLLSKYSNPSHWTFANPTIASLHGVLCFPAVAGYQWWLNPLQFS